MRLSLRFISWPMNIQLLQYHLIKDYTSSIELLLYCCQKPVGHNWGILIYSFLCSIAFARFWYLDNSSLIKFTGECSLLFSRRESIELVLILLKTLSRILWQNHLVLKITFGGAFKLQIHFNTYIWLFKKCISHCVNCGSLSFQRNSSISPKFRSCV